MEQREAMGFRRLGAESHCRTWGAIAPRGCRLVTPWEGRQMADTPCSSDRELSTLSTPPTVRSTVETEEQANASYSGQGSLQGSGGEAAGGKPSGPVDNAWARALLSTEACKRGVCAYKNAEAPRDGQAAARGCDGYHASRGFDLDGRPVVRWFLCARHRAWWVAERRRRAARRAEP